ncbi:MAG: type II secretion system minor pseudopilin GspI [Desulfobacteria bacterium]|jgi:general secretion pathway protein I|nr:type II secretion system minor pseudopilin GspI [Desulfobacterales bacterium]OEU54133.1 MAG: type II secretion system protein GspI [Desulfobacterales bacterium C00003106]OEU59251.1 MAG: type II secretion system protein GspI [Desulfobacterales bacterium C00003104]
MKRDPLHTGFTLLEVMVAIAILAIALVAVLRSQAHTVFVAGEARLSTTASLLAQSKLAEIESNREDSTQGDFGEDFPNYSWETSIRKTELKQLREVILTIKWQEQSLTREYKVSFYQYVEPVD